MSNAPQTPGEIRHWYDIGFAARCIKRLGHWVEFEVLALDSCEAPPLYHRRDSTSYPDPVEDISEAEVYAHGTVKWDGCSDWQLLEAQRACLHSCSRGGIARHATAMERCWDWAGELIGERWQGEL